MVNAVTSLIARRDPTIAKGRCKQERLPRTYKQGGGNVICRKRAGYSLHLGVII